MFFIKNEDCYDVKVKKIPCLCINLRILKEILNFYSSTLGRVTLAPFKKL